MQRRFDPLSPLIPALMTTLLLGAALLAILRLTAPAHAAYVEGESAQQAGAAPTEIVELLRNGNFGTGFGPWWATPSVTPVITDGVLRAIVTNGGANPWDAIVGQHSVPIQAGEAYTLTFNARASRPVTVTVLLQENGGSYATYFSAPLVLTPGAQQHTFHFTAPASNPEATFQFQIGGRGQFDLFLSAISLRGPAPEEPPPVSELIRNGDFSSGFSAWWATASVRTDTSTGELRAEITAPGTNPWDAIVGQHNLDILGNTAYTLAMDIRATRPITVRVVLQENGGDYTQYFSAAIPLTTETQRKTLTFTTPADATDPEATFQFHLGGQGAATIFLDNVSLTGLSTTPEEPDPLPVVRLNQVGYLPLAPKQATISTTATSPLPWRLLNVSGTPVATGTTTVFGLNAASREHVHIADFSAYATVGVSYTLVVSGDQSHPFDIRPTLYAQLKYDALAYFYHNRSGITITMPYAGGQQWTRPAGHLPDRATCFNKTDVDGQQWQGCNYTLDVSRGWYDAGDHGKYVVNGGISAWTLLNQYERTQHIARADESAIADGSMRIPENNNGVPDILDEARWELEFLLAMQVPQGGIVEGVLREGMVHHKIHDEAWTALGLPPHEDPQTRYLYPPSTAATLNMAATAAQCARIWRTFDAAFANRCLTAARTAWAAALANPAVYARNNFTGGGPYDDTDLTDEFYWAAAELFITTGEAPFRTYLQSSPHFLAVTTNAGGQHTSMTWKDTAALGTISLALVPNTLTPAQRQTARANVIRAADHYVALLNAEGYLTPFAVTGTGYPWGSNSFVLNNMLIMGLAYDFTGTVTYLNAVSQAMDYLLGRNPMDQSYVTGYGERPLRNPHHRFWANQINEIFPSPPPGAVSGGPNSALEDPYAQPLLAGCAPQKCFVDHIQSWSTNEITINWNAPFAWVVAFLDENRAFSHTWRLYLPFVAR